MSDMQAFERQLERRIHRFVGPARPVDDLAVFETVVGAGRPHPRGFTMFSALKFVVAGIVVALFGGFLLAAVLTSPQGDDTQPAALIGSPESEVTAESLFELSIPHSAFPDDPTALEAGGWKLIAGTDVTDEPTASQANETMRNRAFLVMSGTVVVEPTTDALIWRTLGVPPEVVPAGEPATLGPGEAIYLPAVAAAEVDSERYLRLANPGDEDATGITFHVHEGSWGEPFGGFPSGLEWRSWSGTLGALPDEELWDAADEILFRLSRHGGGPGATFESSGDPLPSGSMAVYLIESGEVERSIVGPGGEYVNDWRAGSKYSIEELEGVEHSLLVVGNEPATFLELVAVPR